MHSDWKNIYLSGMKASGSVSFKESWDTIVLAGNVLDHLSSCFCLISPNEPGTQEILMLKCINNIISIGQPLHKMVHLFYGLCLSEINRHFISFCWQNTASLFLERHLVCCLMEGHSDQFSMWVHLCITDPWVFREPS